MISPYARQISSEISDCLGYTDACPTKTYNCLVFFLKWTNPDIYRIPAQVNPNNSSHNPAINKFVYEREFAGADESMNHVQDTVELRRFIRPCSPSVHLPESLYHRLAESTRFHFFSSSWLENFARQEDFIMDAVRRSPAKVGILAKRTQHYVNDSIETLSVRPLIIIPYADKAVNQELRKWEERFSVNRYVTPVGMPSKHMN